MCRAIFSTLSLLRISVHLVHWPWSS